MGAHLVLGLRLGFWVGRDIQKEPQFLRGLPPAGVKEAKPRSSVKLGSNSAHREGMAKTGLPLPSPELCTLVPSGWIQRVQAQTLIAAVS